MCLFCWTQRTIFWRKFVIRLFWAPLTSTVEENTMIQNCSVPTFFRISSFVFSRTNTFIQVWKYLRVSMWQNFYFWVNYPLNYIDILMTNNYTHTTILLKQKYNKLIQNINKNSRLKWPCPWQHKDICSKPVFFVQYTLLLSSCLWASRWPVTVFISTPQPMKRFGEFVKL